MDSQIQVLPLRIVAAKCLSTDELEGLQKLDDIGSQMSRVVRHRYRIWSAAFTTLLALTVLSILLGLVMTLSQEQDGQVIAFLGLLQFGLWLSTVFYWRYFQYGGLKARTPQPAIYATPDSPDVRNLERFFGVMQLETTPRAFYITRLGIRKYLKRQFFFGKLRAAILSDDDTVRELVFSPSGLWFGRELFLEANVETIMQQAKVKPNRPGAPKTHSYTDAVMSLIEHPKLRHLVVRKRGSQKIVIDLLDAWYRSNRVNPPSETQLTYYANMILDVIEKNRTANS